MIQKLGRVFPIPIFVLPTFFLDQRFFSGQKYFWGWDGITKPRPLIISNKSQGLEDVWNIYLSVISFFHDKHIFCFCWPVLSAFLTFLPSFSEKYYSTLLCEIDPIRDAIKALKRKKCGGLFFSFLGVLRILFPFEILFLNRKKGRGKRFLMMHAERN